MTALADHPSADTADGGLVRAYLAGDTGAFDALFRRYHPDILRMMYAKTHDWALAEDLTQETFARALRYLETYNPTRPFWPWLRTIAFNLSSHELYRRSTEVPVEEVDQGAAMLADDSEQVVSREAVAEVLKQLKPRQQRALILRYVEDRDSNDIALLLGLKRNALEQLLRRARVTFSKEYSVRNGAPLPVFAALAARVRRVLTAVEARINIATNATMAVAGDFAIGAALTVSGIGIVAGISGMTGASEAVAHEPTAQAFTGHLVATEHAGSPEDARRAMGTLAYVGSPGSGTYGTAAGPGAAWTGGAAVESVSTRDAAGPGPTGTAPAAPAAPEVPKTRAVHPVDAPEADQPQTRQTKPKVGTVGGEREVEVGGETVAEVDTSTTVEDGAESSTSVSVGGLDPVVVEGATDDLGNTCLGTCP